MIEGGQFIVEGLLKKVREWEGDQKLNLVRVRVRREPQAARPGSQEYGEVRATNRWK